MKSYMESFDLWNVVEEDYEVSLLPENSSMAQIKHHGEKKTKKVKAKIFAGVSQTFFTKIMTFDSFKENWDYLKEEYEGDDHVRGMQVLNMMREFEEQKMKEFETIKRVLGQIVGHR